ncbi:hypothetical protein Goarm_016836 [Gossypium armourianum]|uniref:non-specific serine/threonine protein kinase n=1 Tax=Gossypium armourianum TaxID=34283 RepID=A0A7J9JDU1_9ROSI|nr:hypothetical protein [Gossypium armourianum]
MKTFQYFKDKFRSKGQRSTPELTEERKSEEYSGLDRTTRSSFEDVYKGTIKPADAKGTKEWLAEVQFLGVVEHPNLIKLIGHSAVNGKREIPRLLVYEFMQNKSLDYHLFQSAFPPLPWKTRLQIILGAAQGLAYLHEGLAVQVIYRDFKPSNVLLDDKFNPKLSGFGLATEGPMAGDTHVSTDVSIVFSVLGVVGTYGYADPCYLRTGHLTVKSHIWGFGVVLYEILSGRRSIDRELPQAKELLLHWVKRSPAGSKKFISIMDPGLGNQYSIGAAREIARLADACLLTSPEGRPKMSEVVERLKQIIQVSEEEARTKWKVILRHLNPKSKQDYDSRPMKLWPMLQEIDTLISQIGTVVFNISPL